MLTNWMPHPQLAVTLLVIPVFIASYLVGGRLNKRVGEQKFLVSSVVKIGPQPGVRLLLFQIAFPSFIFLFAWLLGGEWFDLFGGGYLVFLLFGLVAGFRRLLYIQALCTPNAANGQIKFSAAFGYQVQSNESLAIGLVCLLMFLVFGGWHFLGAAWLAFSTAIGFWRRCRQAAKLQGAIQPAL